jgi:hypothetical protein
MKQSLLFRLYGGLLLAILLLIVVHAPIIVVGATWFSAYAAEIKAWKELLMVPLILIAAWLLTRQHLWRQLLSNRLTQLCLAFIALHLALALVLPGDVLSKVAGLMIDLRFVTFFLLMAIAATVSAAFKRRSLKVAAIGAAVVIGFGLLQITVLPDNILNGLGYSPSTIRPYTTIDRNPDFVRINSTLRGPNPLGALMIIYMALGVAYLLRRSHTRGGAAYWASIVGVIGGAAVLVATFSRSAYFGGLIMATRLATSAWRPSKRMIAIVSAGVLACLAGILLASGSDWFSNVILHVDPESTVAQKSDQGHARSVSEAVVQAVHQPIGAGIGSTGSAALYGKDTGPTIENYYLFVAHESGWIGLLLFLAIFVLVMMVLWRQNSWAARGLFASGLGLAVIGLLLPVWADDTVALVWWGLAGTIAGSGIIGKHGNQGASKQETAGTA